MIAVEHVLKSHKPIENSSIKSLRHQIISEINHLVQAMDIKHIDGWECIPFSNIDLLVSESKVSTEELFVLQDFLETKYEEFLYDLYQEEYYLHHNTLI